MLLVGTDEVLVGQLAVVQDGARSAEGHMSVDVWVEWPYITDDQEKKRCPEIERES